MMLPYAAVSVCGLSPRVRGKPNTRLLLVSAARSIPACAGETRWASAPAWGHPVYPRVCGGNLARQFQEGGYAGLSPRVRGKREAAYGADGRIGSIPACAGETKGRCSDDRHAGVYPRVCGGNLADADILRMGFGLSPRVRGKHGGGANHRLPPGSIPACAGETMRCSCPSCWRWVYPRVCGGNSDLRGVMDSRRGLSPRVRGKQWRPACRPAGCRSIPACAGETGGKGQPGNERRVYPRVCGGNTEPGGNASDALGLSPRVRGKRM